MSENYLGACFDLDKDKLVTFIGTYCLPKPPNTSFSSIAAFLASVMADPKGWQGGEEDMEAVEAVEVMAEVMWEKIDKGQMVKNERNTKEND